jgi:hypothetical protein
MFQRKYDDMIKKGKCPDKGGLYRAGIPKTGLRSRKRDNTCVQVQTQIQKISTTSFAALQTGELAF